VRARFDSPSVFGALLDREAGAFRLGPFGINVPSQRAYEAGTNTLVTTWKTPTGWIEVHDALTMGPRQGEDAVTPHTRPPADDDADHLLVRTVRCLDGYVEVELVCEPIFDYGRALADWTPVDGSRHVADATGAGQTVRLASSMALGIEANRVRARHVLRQDEQLWCALSWVQDLTVPTDLDDAGGRLAATTRFWRTWLGRARFPDRRWRPPHPALGPGHEGPHLHAEAGPGLGGRRGVRLRTRLHPAPHPPQPTPAAAAVADRAGPGGLRQHCDTDALDASILLAAVFGFLPADDPRLRARVLAIAEELTEHGFVLRYRTEETDDGLSGKEGTFLICSFWLVSALAVVGRRQPARGLMERLLRVDSPLGLLAEEFDTDTGHHLGNFPQAFSHLALIEAAGRIILDERMEELQG
jgi:GH15 family glucan-1,4-alpha-glucosidase